VQRFTRQNDPYRKQGSTSYPNTKTQFEPRVAQAIDALKGEPRRLVRTASTPSATSAPASACAFHAGDRVEHAIFGRGEILRIEQADGDWKLVVDFPNAGQKTLLTKYAKLRKL
jgi:DNA helicase-2/ATP-dependent DNA helicase PcrA